MKFKYYIMPINASTLPKPMEEDERKLNELGAEGWELVSVIPVTAKGTTDDAFAYFKHPIAE